MRDHSTPGPWDHVGNEGAQALIQAKDGSIIAMVYGKGRIECAANTFLISAAPDMANALQALLKEFHQHVTASCPEVVRAAESALQALRKARGHLAESKPT